MKKLKLFEVLIISKWICGPQKIYSYPQTHIKGIYYGLGSTTTTTRLFWRVIREFLKNFNVKIMFRKVQ